jgi:hypothetical protein
LLDVLARDPGRVIVAWRNNIVAFVGDGGRAIQLELLGFPANWLAVVGIVGWLVAPWLGLHRPAGARALLVWIGITVATIAFGLGLTRFFLVLAPVYALAAAWVIVAAAQRGTTTDPGAAARRGEAFWRNASPLREDATDPDGVETPHVDRRETPHVDRRETPHVDRKETPHVDRKETPQRGVSTVAMFGLGAATAGLALLLSGTSAGTQQVLAGEAAAEAQIVRATRAALQPGETLAVVVPARVSLGKYSAIADRVVATTLNPAVLAASGADLLILARDAGAPPPGATQVDAAGIFTLYRLAAP